MSTFTDALAEIVARQFNQSARIEIICLANELQRRNEFPGALANRETASGVLHSVSEGPGKP